MVFDALIFSRDRPAQLDLLLRSIGRHAAGRFSSLSVLWTCSHVGYEQGYRIVRDAWSEIRWGREADFEQDVRDWLDQAGPVVSFLVDDDVFYRDAPPPARLPWSYRGSDYDYPFSLDGNVYKRPDVLELIAYWTFNDPTELEAGGHARRRRLPFTRVHACEPPCLVGIPANRVSSSSGMPHMGVDPAMLNERFLAGERLLIPDRWPEADFGAHAEIPLVFAPRELPAMYGPRVL